jgi:hypothetical protein
MAPKPEPPDPAKAKRLRHRAKASRALARIMTSVADAAYYLNLAKSRPSYRETGAAFSTSKRPASRLVAHDKGILFLDRPGRREAATSH